MQLERKRLAPKEQLLGRGGLMVSPIPAGSQGTALCTEGKRPPLTFSPVRISFRNGAKTSSEEKKPQESLSPAEPN